MKSLMKHWELFIDDIRENPDSFTPEFFDALDIIEQYIYDICGVERVADDATNSEAVPKRS